MIENQKNILRARCADLGLFLRLLFWLTAALLAVRAAYGIWLAFQPADWLIGHFSLGVNWTGQADWQGAVRLAGMLSFWWHTLTWLPVLGILWYCRAIFRGIDQQGTPFLPENARAVRGIGVLVMLMSVLRGDALRGLYRSCGFAVTQQEELVRDGVQLVSGNGDGSFVNMTYILLGAVIICLSYVFAYGAALQQESDETL